MADISRLFNFVTGTPIKESEVDAEFDQLVATVNNLDGANIAANAITNSHLADDSVTAAEIAAGAVTDSEIASTAGVYAAYRTVTEHYGVADNNNAAGTYFFEGGSLALSGSNIGGFRMIAPFFLTAADYAITGRTTKLLVVGRAYNNSVDTAITMTVGLYPIASNSGTSANRSFTLGTVVAGSTVACDPAANNHAGGTSGDFNFPSDGNYMLGVVLSGTPAANSMATIGVQLLLRWV